MVSLGLVVSDYRKKMTTKMLEFAQKKATELNAEIKSIKRVPGVLESPLAVKQLLEESKVDAVIVLGVVIEGGTWHDIMVAGNATRKLTDLSLEFKKPVCSGIIGPRASKAQAMARLRRYAEHAVEAAVKMV